MKLFEKLFGKKQGAGGNGGNGQNLVSSKGVVMSEHAVITCGQPGEIRDPSLGPQPVVEAFKENTATRFVLTFLPRDQLKAAMLKGGGMAERIGIENNQQVENLFEKGHTEIKGQPVTLEWCSCNDTRSHKQSGVTLTIM